MISLFTAAMPRRLPILGVFLLVLLASGCVTGPRLVTPEPPPIPEGGPPVPEANEVVLSDNTQLVANTAFGHIKIEAGPGLRRVFTWNDVRRGAIMEPREKRFAGSLGIKYDGKPPVWQTAEGVTQLRYEEGQRRFENFDDAKIWMQIRRLHYTYNNSGIVVGWQQKGDTLHVELWQFYIDGKQPTVMANADDAAIDVSPLTVVPQKMKPQLVYADGHSEPYNTETASAYKGAGASTAAGASAQASNCNVFKRLFGKCPAPKPAPAPEAEASAAAAAETAPPAGNADASGKAADSTTSKKASPKKAESAPRAVIDGGTVNIRSRATTKSDVLFQAKKGDSVVIRKEEKDWRYVEFEDGRKGWVANFLLKH
ncbi:SH3 domain-containing protein [Salinisphaera aquimarina]|uniref:SH3 domain-containing protein n=1 Tax=Salinisphaera aquimarina TaxID=2094031 RepID=A0ABV7EXZ1_9GAMM